MSGGIPILGTVTKKCSVTTLSKFSFKITLTQGLNRQIRRMCEYLDYKVVCLKRTRIMNVSLSNLEKGEWRALTEKEIATINALISTSSKTEEASVDTRKIKKTKTGKHPYKKRKNKNF